MVKDICVEDKPFKNDMSVAAKFLKSTLSLPGSKFPPRPTPQSINTYLSKCDELYTWQQRERSASTHGRFVLHDGPPYANGELHVGHALNKIIKDIICRANLINGRRVEFVPGWDCHGLPIELKAFEKNGWDRASGIDPVKIRGAARGFAQKTIQAQMRTFKSWGILGDWDAHYETMNKDFELRQLKVFKAMVEHGLIVRKHKPVHWSPSSQTALAEAEIERDWHVSTAALVKFRIPATIGGVAEPVHAVIWTTTPWTLPANQAIAVNKDFKYILVRSQKHGLLVVAHSRVEYLNEKLEETTETITVLPGSALMECTYSGLAQFGEEALNRPIIHADFVSEEEGTGLVHCAPGHGLDDYNALQPQIRAGQVMVKAPVNDRGEFTDSASPADPTLLRGKYVFKEGNDAVLALLEKENVLIMSYKFRHKYPIDWRTKGPLITRATAQWFTDISSIKSDVINSLKNVKFQPESGESRLRSFVENRSEWCISRQRAWGVPIPALYHKETNEAVLTPKSVEHVIDTIKERGIDRWWSDSAHDPAWVPSELNVEDFVRGRDTMDVWFDSGTSWTLLADLDGDHDKMPALADVYLEGSDQHRGWFQSSILTAIAYQRARYPENTPAAPYKHLITHGFTLDADGKKMSKSIGNVISPDQIMTGLTPNPAPKKGRALHPLGPDVLRLWAAGSDWTTDVTISEKVISAVHKSLDKYRVTMKVLLGMLSTFDVQTVAESHQASHKPSAVHRIALHQLDNLRVEVLHHYTRYEFHKAVAAINEWLARDLSAFYLEAIKDVVYCDPKSTDGKDAQLTLLKILTVWQTILAPVTPLLVEESYEFSPAYLKDPDLVPEFLRPLAVHPLQRTWANVAFAAPPSDDPAIANLGSILQINTAVKAAQERARAEKVLGQSLACDVVICTPAHENLHISTEDWQKLLVVSSVQQTICDPNAFNALTNLSTPDEDERSAVRLSIASQDVQRGTHPWTFCQEITDASHKVLGYVLVRPPRQDKCARCWRYQAPAEIDKKYHAHLCGRCHGVLEDMESRGEAKFVAAE